MITSLTELRTWAKEKPLFWSNLTLVIITGFILFLTAEGHESRVRWWGMALQIIGIWTVWRNLSQTARDFQAEGIFRSTWTWLKRGLWRQNVVVGAAGIALGAATSSARGKVSTPYDPSAPIEERVGVLAEKLNELDARIDQAFDEIDRRAADAGARIQAEERERKRAMDEVHQRLKQATIGQYGLLVFGAFWLIVGVVFGTASPELNKVMTGHLRDVVTAILMF